MRLDSYINKLERNEKTLKRKSLRFDKTDMLLSFIGISQREKEIFYKIPSVFLAPICELYKKHEVTMDNGEEFIYLSELYDEFVRDFQYRIRVLDYYHNAIDNNLDVSSEFWNENEELLKCYSHTHKKEYKKEISSFMLNEYLLKINKTITTWKEQSGAKKKK